MFRGEILHSGTATEVSCGAGTMQTLPGAASSTDYKQVYGGYFGSSSGQSAPTGVCSPGYFCPPDSISATQNPCPVATFRSLPGASATTDCGDIQQASLVDCTQSLLWRA